jgi:rubrerythrin
VPVDYARSYAKKPVKAALKLAWVTEQCRRARARGDHEEADQWDSARGQLEALLAGLHRCRVCGRALYDPDSVHAGIGPECARGKP